MPANDRIWLDHGQYTDAADIRRRLFGTMYSKYNLL